MSKSAQVMAKLDLHGHWFNWGAALIFPSAKIHLVQGKMTWGRQQCPICFLFSPILSFVTSRGIEEGKGG